LSDDDIRFAVKRLIETQDGFRRDIEQEPSDTAASRLSDQQGYRKDIAGGADHDKKGQPPREPGSVEDLTHFGDGADKIRPTAGERPGPRAID